MPWTRAIRDTAWLKARVNVDPMTGCWEWNLARTRLGYGYYGDATGPKHKTSKAHRLAFELAFGHLPPAVLHRCDNPPCCNPAHLQAGTQRDNIRDMLTKGRARARVSWEQVDEIRTALAHGAVARRLAESYGVNEALISRIKTGTSWVRDEDRPAFDEQRKNRLCIQCQEPIPVARNAKTIYCSPRCRNAHHTAKTQQSSSQTRNGWQS